MFKGAGINKSNNVSKFLGVNVKFAIVKHIYSFMKKMEIAILKAT